MKRPDTSGWPDRRERSDGYSGEIARHGRHRVILHRYGFVWIIQRKAEYGPPSRCWLRCQFVTRKAQLLRLWAVAEPLAGPVAALDALPPEASQMGRVVS